MACRTPDRMPEHSILPQWFALLPPSRDGLLYWTQLVGVIDVSLVEAVGRVQTGEPVMEPHGVLVKLVLLFFVPQR